MKKPIDYSLYLVTDREVCYGKDLLGIISEAVRGGVTIVQLREKKILTKEFLDLAFSVKALLDVHNVPLIINDRIDIALAVEADGVHLGQSDMPLGLARKILGDKYIIGVSVDSINMAIDAQNKGADYIAVSPIWATPTKTDLSREVGIKLTKIIASSVSIPVVGIGNIKYNNIKEVVEAGCDGVAVVSAIMAAEDSFKAAKQLQNALKGARDVENRPLRNRL